MLKDHNLDSAIENQIASKHSREYETKKEK
jgi:hypothetical protein